MTDSRSARRRVADLEKFLAEAEAKQRLVSCQTCANEAVRQVVTAFLDKLQLGTTSITLSHLHKHMLVPDLKGPRSYESLKRHVKQCLERDVRTGQPLSREENAGDGQEA